MAVVETYVLSLGEFLQLHLAQHTGLHLSHHLQPEGRHALSFQPIEGEGRPLQLQRLKDWTHLMKRILKTEEIHLKTGKCSYFTKILFYDHSSVPLPLLDKS